MCCLGFKDFRVFRRRQVKNPLQSMEKVILTERNEFHVALKLFSCLFFSLFLCSLTVKSYRNAFRAPQHRKTQIKLKYIIQKMLMISFSSRISNTQNSSFVKSTIYFYIWFVQCFSFLFFFCLLDRHFIWNWPPHYRHCLQVIQSFHQNEQPNDLDSFSNPNKLALILPITPKKKTINRMLLNIRDAMITIYRK